MPRVLFDARWTGRHGIGRVAEEYRRRLKGDFAVVEMSGDAKPSSPLDIVRTARAFSREQADLFVTPGFNGNPLLGRRQVFFVHDLTHIQFDDKKVWLKRIFYDTVIRAAAARAAAVVTVSEFARDQIASRWPECADRLHVVPNGISGAFTAPPPGLANPGRRRGLVMFCNNRWHKNLPTMLEALSRTRRDAPEAFAELCPITLVGTYSEDVRDLVVRNGLEDRVVAAGPVDDETLAGLYRGARALLFCSLSEGFGLPIVEAIACGASVVCSDIPAFREIAGSGCVFVDPHSPEQISSALRSVALADSGRSSDAIGEIRAKFSWDRSYAQLKSIVGNALSAA